MVPIHIDVYIIKCNAHPYPLNSTVVNPENVDAKSVKIAQCSAVFIDHLR